MKIEVGHNVTVLDEDSKYSEETGVVIAIKFGSDWSRCITVKFSGKYILEWELNPIADFGEEDLEVQGELLIIHGISTISQLFESSPRAIFAKGYIFSPENACDYVGCRCKASKRILVKVSDNVYEFDMCYLHAGWHGVHVERFPFRENWGPGIKIALDSLEWKPNKKKGVSS